VEISGLLQQVPGDSQADGGRHEDQVEEDGEVRQELRGSGDQSEAELQLRLEPPPLGVLCEVRPQSPVTASQHYNLYRPEYFLCCHKTNKNKLRHAAKWPMDVTNGTDQPTDLQTDGLQELLEWQLATKNYEQH